VDVVIDALFLQPALGFQAQMLERLRRRRLEHVVHRRPMRAHDTAGVEHFVIGELKGLVSANICDSYRRLVLADSRHGLFAVHGWPGSAASRRRVEPRNTGANRTTSAVKVISLPTHRTVNRACKGNARWVSAAAG